MTNVRIGDKTIAFPSGMSDSEIEKKILQIKIDSIKNLKTAKPSRIGKAKGGLMRKPKLAKRGF